MSLAQLPPQMQASLALLPPAETSVVLLTRHSIREIVTGQGLAGYDLQLTAEGVALARAWGAALVEQSQREIRSCTTSRIQRCIDTSTLMLEGAGQAVIHDLVLKQSELLVEPGSFVLQIEKASPVFKAFGAIGFVNQFLANQVSGMKSVRQGVLDILKSAYQIQYAQHGGLHLMVSHDTIIAVIYALLAERTALMSEDWPQMMEGLFFWFEGETFLESNLVWVWRGQRNSVCIANIK